MEQGQYVASIDCNAETLRQNMERTNETNVLPGSIIYSRHHDAFFIVLKINQTNYKIHDLHFDGERFYYDLENTISKQRQHNFAKNRLLEVVHPMVLLYR